MPEEAFTIPAIPEIPDDLRVAAVTGSVVPFVGAGASRLAGCPGWDGFANTLLRQLVSKQVLNFSELDQIQSRQLSPRVKLSLARIIARSAKVSLDYEVAIHPTRKADDAEGQRLYAALTRLGRSYVTTNYDYWLDDPISSAPAVGSAAGTVGSVARSVIYDPADVSFDKLTENTTIHLHGSLRSPDSMVVTTSDYVERYRASAIGNDNPVGAFLRTLFSQRVVLFIGYGLDELEVLDYIAVKRDARLGPKELKPKHYLLQAFFSHEAQVAKHLEEYYREECGVQLLPFLRDENDHGQLIAVLESFAAQIPAGDTLHIEKRLSMEALLDT